MGLQWEAAAMEAGVLPAQCGTAVPLPPRHRGPEDTQDVQIHLAQGGCGEGGRQSPTHKAWDTWLQQRKVRQL